MDEDGGAEDPGVEKKILGFRARYDGEKLRGDPRPWWNMLVWCDGQGVIVRAEGW